MSVNTQKTPKLSTVEGSSSVVASKPKDTLQALRAHAEHIRFQIENVQLDADDMLGQASITTLIKWVRRSLRLFRRTMIKTMRHWSRFLLKVRALYKKMQHPTEHNNS